MKVFVIASVVPHRQHTAYGVTSIHIVLYEFLSSFMRLDCKIVLQMIFNVFRLADSLTPVEGNELNHLRDLGVTVLPPIFPKQYTGPSTTPPRIRRALKWLGVLMGRNYVEDIYPAVKLRNMVSERIRSSGSDAILTFCSPEGVAATFGFHELPKIAYNGAIDFLPGAAHLKDRKLWSSDSGSAFDRVLVPIFTKLWITKAKRSHLTLMNDVDVVANVTASDADFYKKHRHPRSIYVRNTWTDLGVQHLDNFRNSTSRRMIKIIGHAGFLNRTANTYGLKFLLVDLLPELEKVMKGLNYKIHIIGGDEPAPSLKPLLNHERIVVDGYVEDFYAKLRSSDIFLLLNNAGPFVGAFARHLVAWSLGLCLIVHANSKKAMPEIMHMKNALIGSTPSEIAQMVYMAATDSDLNERIRRGGRATYEKYFRPSVIAAELYEEISRQLNKTQGNS